MSIFFPGDFCDANRWTSYRLVSHNSHRLDIGASTRCSVLAGRQSCLANMAKSQLVQQTKVEELGVQCARGKATKRASSASDILAALSGAPAEDNGPGSSRKLTHYHLVSYVSVLPPMLLVCGYDPSNCPNRILPICVRERQGAGHRNCGSSTDRSMLYPAKEDAICWIIRS